MAKLNEDDRMLWGAVVDAFSNYADALLGLGWLNDPADVVRHALRQENEAYAALDIYGCLTPTVQRELVPDLLALASRRPSLRADVDDRLMLLGRSELLACLETSLPSLLASNDVRTMDELLRLYLSLDAENFTLLLPRLCEQASAAMCALSEAYRQRIWG